MTELLSFLLYWGHRVYEWFGGLYELGRQTTLYALSWAIDQANRAIRVAYNQANTLTNGALATAWNWIVQKYNDAIAYIYSVRDYLAGLFNSIYKWVASKILDAENRLKAIVKSSESLTTQLINNLKGEVKAGQQANRDFISAVIAELKSLLQTSIKGINADIAEIKKLTHAINSAGTPILGSFITNPLGFIAAHLWSLFQDMLCFSLAYGLGTTKYQLPPLPNWTGGGAAPGYIPPSGAQVNASGIVRPLDSISVSGYTFDASHKGVDLGLINDQPVYAMHDGTVQVAEYSQVGYGFNVVVSGGDWWSRYAHLNSLAVRVGDRITAGQAIGLGDSTGNSTGPHLHLEIKYRGQFIDPLTVL